MAGTFAVLAPVDGQLPNSKAAILTVPGATSYYLKTFFLFNTNAATQTILLYINSSGTSRQFARIVLAQNESADIIEQGESIELAAADTIEAVTTTASAVDYTITGVKET